MHKYESGSFINKVWPASFQSGVRVFICRIVQDELPRHGHPGLWQPVNATLAAADRAWRFSQNG